MPTQEHILALISDSQVSYLLERTLASFGYQVTARNDPAETYNLLKASRVDLVMLSEQFATTGWEEVATYLRKAFPSIPILLFAKEDSHELTKKALAIGISDYTCFPLQTDQLKRAVQNCLTKSKDLRDHQIVESKRATASLQRKVDELQTLRELGQTITGSLDLDSVLAAVVDAAVKLTSAEEGSLLLLDDESGELYMRAAQNFQEDFVRTFRLPVNNTLAGQVLTSGQPVLLDENTPQKIKTSYLVHTLVYVPLKLKQRVIGVLGVDNRSLNQNSFAEHDLKVLTAVAEYAVIAIDNARLYSATYTERNKLETILAKIQDGVMVFDSDQRLTMINRMGMAALSLAEPALGKPARELITQPELLALIENPDRVISNRVEIEVRDGQVFEAQMVSIPDVGQAFTLHDITYHKKLDHLKTEFVNTVSHDLRSPLTAILGYVELIERAGPVTDMQKDFIRRVQTSVQNITRLVDELVNLGRIEAGFDAHKENIRLDQVIRYSADGYKKALADKEHQLLIEIPDDLPAVYGNAVQLRQMVDHLLDNAIKYTVRGGHITIHSEVEEDQIIIQVTDTGIGIPPLDLPFIFDKFYRASNAHTETSGTGLGLAIVKSIVENHQGRIWVDSKLGEGTTFTVVIPLP
ncbi:MAG TPA: ATP-binding protein [Longilinea sp.]|nr:ATP-binding protein [Longilinea sp.]